MLFSVTSNISVKPLNIILLFHFGRNKFVARRFIFQLTYFHKPIRVYGKDASRLTSPSLTVTTRTMEGETTKRPLEMRIGNEGVSYFRKYQPFYIEGDDDNMIYFIYDIKRKEEATLFYIKPDALDFQDSQKLQEAFADKNSFDLYTTFVRDETIPRVTTHAFKHMMTVSDWTGEYGFKVFIPALFEPGKTYIALKPTKGSVFFVISMLYNYNCINHFSLSVKVYLIRGRYLLHHVNFPDYWASCRWWMYT